MNPAHLQIGIDTGGTFTDLVAWDGTTLRTAKVPSTPPDFHRGVVTAIEAVLGEDDFADLVHGSTVATNALLERKGHPIAFVTTEGFRDLLLIGRQNRPLLYDLQPRRNPPIVADDHCFTLKERIGSDGRVLRPLNIVEIDGLIRQIRQAKSEHVAVCLLFSFVNPIHEQQVADRLRAAGLTVTLSSELLPEFREYERGSATAVNAALRPIVQYYLGQLATALPAAVKSLQVMHSGGGTLPPEDASRFAARLLLSGPAGGVLGANHVAKLEGFDRIITYDMGGTSTDVAAVIDGKPPWTNTATVDGLPVPLTMFDIHTIGAGGGSIASLDIGGALRVGPRSAGANPGPACYGRGGTLPTVTDANLLLGRLLPDRFLGGRMRLHRDQAESAIAPLARQMGKSLTEAALGIIHIAEASMAAAVRKVTAGKGHDPRGFTLVCFGGAGGLHAAAIAESLEITRVLVPPHAGLLSALGMVVAPPLVDVSRTIVNLPLTESSLQLEFAQLARSSGQMLPAESTVAIEQHADCRFKGQSYELTVPVEDLSITAIEGRFRRAYELQYGHCPTGRGMEIVTLRLRRIGRAATLTLPGIIPGAAKHESTKIVLTNGQAALVPVLDRPALAAQDNTNGPALLADPDATTFIPSGWTARVTPTGGVLLAQNAKIFGQSV
jgi:N-methylhydantoinase A